ncbi:MAG: PulJ/GspJ family protein [Candidatus Hydrogenedentales bacterium]
MLIIWRDNIFCFGKDSDRKGFTLMEITFAMSLFLIVLGVVAQSLISSFHVLLIEEQRTNALNGCKSVLSNLRQVAYNAEPTSGCSEDNPLIPCVLLEWIGKFPTSKDRIKPAEINQWQPFFLLPWQEYAFHCTDGSGNIARTSLSPAMNTNPVFVTVTTSWTGLRGRRYTMSASAIISDH